MSLFKPFFFSIERQIIAIFRLRNLLWHVLAILLTYVLVVSGFDWWYFEHTRAFFSLGIGAALLGFLLPVLLPATLFAIGALGRQRFPLELSYSLGQSAALAWFLSAFYKALSGRVHPALSDVGATVSDISRTFHFGLLQGGVVWGWPSSHTCVAFALAATTCLLVQKTWIRFLALLLALYIGLGVSVTIHWFSDFAAGAIFGSLVGVVVGTAFKQRFTKGILSS